MEAIEATNELRAELVEIGRQYTTGQHRLVRLVARIDRSNVWAADGALSAAAWVAGLLDVESCTAREWVRIGRALESLPVIDTAFEQGRLSLSKVRVLTRVATAETETELLAIAESVPASQFHRAVACWRAGREGPEETDERQRHDRSFTTWVDADGMVCGHFRLPPLDGGALVAAIETDLMRRQADPHDATAVASVPLLAQRADAFSRLVSGGGSASFEVVLHVRADGATLDDGTPISQTAVERIAPQSFLRALIHDADGRPINASGRHRHPTTRQKRVVKERDRACIDCGTTSLLEHDHRPAFETTGRTVVDELELRCAPCHRRRHRAA